MLAEAVADQVQCDGIDAGIEERQTETDDAEVMPEIIVGIMGVRMEVEPHEEHVIWKEANATVVVGWRPVKEEYNLLGA